MHTRPSSLPRHVISFSSFFVPPFSLSFTLSPRSPVPLLSTSISFFPSSHNSDQRRENQAKAIVGAPRRNRPPKGEEWVREANGTDRPPLPVSEIKRRGRNLAEGCKYYKVTLRRMRELKGLPREGGKRAPGGQCERVSKRGPLPLSDVNYVRKG